MEDYYLLPSNKGSFTSSTKSGSLNILIDVSVHKPIASKIIVSPNLSLKKQISRQDASCFNVICLLTCFEKKLILNIKCRYINKFFLLILKNLL